jgi:hypothetical protein
MASDICIAVAYAFGNDSSAEPTKGSVAAGKILLWIILSETSANHTQQGYALIMPLVVAGTCLLEQLADPITSPGGSRMIFVDQPLHTDLFNQTSTQLAWVIEKMDYIANKVGVNWAATMSSFLKGQKRVYYDIGRS